MSFTLNVSLVGLNALIPGTSVDPSEGRRVDRLHVLVPEASGGLLPVTEDGVTRDRRVCRHDPVLLWEESDGRQQRTLAGQWIELELPESADGVFLDPSWDNVASLASALNEVEVRVEPKLLGGPGQDPPDSSLVVGSLMLTSGIVHGDKNSPLLLDFKNPGNRYVGRFCGQARIEVPVAADECYLRLVPFDRGEADRVRLAPRPGRSSVDVTIQNLCDQRDEVREDADFARYYDLLPNYQGKRYVPHVAGPPSEGLVALATLDPHGCIPVKP